MAVLGRNEFFKSYQTLANNHLNLSAWFGYNEVITKTPYSLKSVDFDFYLDTNSFFYFIFNKNKELFSAVRLGNNSVFPPANLTVKQTGEFISSLPLDIKDISPKKWHHGQFVFEKDLKTVILKIDNINVANLQSFHWSDQKFGFRGSNNKVLIDNVIAKDVNDKRLFFDNFSNYGKLFLLKYILILITIGLTNLIIFLVSLHFRKKDLIAAIFSVTIYAATLLGVLMIIVWYMWSIFTPSYPMEGSILKNIGHRLNIKGLPVFANDPFVHSEEDMDHFKKYQSNNKKKIIFIGTSQTWGAGAEKENEAMVKVFDSNLIKYASESANKKDYQVINTAISGSDSTELLHFYKENWIKLLPKIVIINLSNNDRNNEIFKKNLQEFIKLNNEQKIKTVFVLEANSLENTPTELINHKIMRNIGIEGGALVLDLHSYVKSKRDTGILWWDSVHPTSYGHQLIGDFIFESVKDML